MTESDRVPARPLFAGVAALLIALLVVAIVHPISRDENQYVAATAFAAQGLLPYRDFAYLQTPLQPPLSAPLAWLFPGWLLLALRVGNTFLALLTVIFVHATVRRLGANARSAALASLLLACCYPFLWGAGVARNDMLPAALLSCGLWIRSGRGSGWAFLLAGLCFGLAASAKISYALCAAAIGLASLFPWSGPNLRRSLWLLAGGLAGAAPTFWFASLAPGAFWFEAYTFPAEAPLLWYRDFGKPGPLGIQRFLYMFGITLLGPTALAMAAVFVRARARRHLWAPGTDRFILIAAAFGGLVSAALNRPFQLQYLIPLLPPLFIAFALAISDQPLRPIWRKATAVFAVAGVAIPLLWVGKVATGRPAPPLALERDAHALGKLLDAMGDSRPMQTLYAAYVIDSGHPLDVRFAAGPELFRTHGMLSGEEAALYHFVTRDQGATLELAGPVVTMPPQSRHGAKARKFALSDAVLIDAARKQGFTPIAAAGKLQLWSAGER